MRDNYADRDAQANFATASTAAGVPAVVTISADPTQFWAIDWITWSYAGDPTGGNLQITIDGVLVWQVDITVGGPGHLEFDRAIYKQVLGKAVIVTLADGGVANKVNVRYR